MISVWKTSGAEETYYINTSTYRPEMEALRVQAVCHSRLYPEWKNPHQARPYILASLILSGHDAFSSAETGPVRLRPGTFRLADLNVPSPHTHRTNIDVLERYFVLLEVTPLLQTVLNRLFPQGLPTFAATSPGRLKKCFEDLRDLLAPDGRPDDTLAGAMAFRLLVEAAGQLPRTAAPLALVRAQAYIDNHFCEKNLDRERIAAAAGVSVSTLGRLLRRNRNTTIQAQVTKLRLEKACHMLRFSDAPIREIANGCGYAYAYYFAREFKKYFGLSPHEYRTRNGCGARL